MASLTFNSPIARHHRRFCNQLTLVLGVTCALAAWASPGSTFESQPAGLAGHATSGLAAAGHGAQTGARQHSLRPHRRRLTCETLGLCSLGQVRAFQGDIHNSEEGRGGKH